MSRRFHSTSHMKGGFNIDESKLSPNANYWKMCARGSYDALVKMIGEDKAKELSNNVLYNTEKNWKEKWSEIEGLILLTEKENDGTMDNLPKKSLPLKAWWVAVCGGQSEGRVGGCGKSFSMVTVKHVDGFMKCPHCGHLN